MTSSVAAVKAQLVAILAPALGSDTQVLYGSIASATTTGSQALTVGKVAGTRELRSLTRLSCHERYTVELVAAVSSSSAGQQEVDEAVMAIYELAEVTIRSYPGGSDLGLAASGVLKILPLGEFELVEQADENGWHAAVRFAADVVAQTT